MSDMSDEKELRKVRDLTEEQKELYLSMTIAQREWVRELIARVRGLKADVRALEEDQHNEREMVAEATNPLLRTVCEVSAFLDLHPDTLREAPPSSTGLEWLRFTRALGRLSREADEVRGLLP